MKRGANKNFSRPQPLSKTVSLSALLPGDSIFVTNLKANRYNYITTSQDPTISIRNFPRSIKLNIDRLRAILNEDTNTPFSSNVIMHAALVNGLKFYESHQDIKSLSQIRSLFDKISDEIDEEVAMVLSGFFENMKIDLFEEGSKFISIRVSPHTHGLLSDIKDNTEITLTDITLLCLIHPLIEEDTTMKGHRKQYQEKENKFLSKVNIRYQGLNALLKCYKLM